MNDDWISSCDDLLLPPKMVAEREAAVKKRAMREQQEHERAIHRAEWAAVRARNLANGNIPSLIKKENINMNLNQSIIIAAVIIGVAIVLAAFISRPSGGARYKSIGTDRIFDVQTGEVKWADPPDNSEWGKVEPVPKGKK